MNIERKYYVMIINFIKLATKEIYFEKPYTASHFPNYQNTFYFNLIVKIFRKHCSLSVAMNYLSLKTILTIRKRWIHSETIKQSKTTKRRRFPLETTNP